MIVIDHQWKLYHIFISTTLRQCSNQTNTSVVTRIIQYHDNLLLANNILLDQPERSNSLMESIIQHDYILWVEHHALTGKATSPLADADH